MFCSITVLPVRGGATMRARWPLPSGAIRSMIRVVMSALRLGIVVARLERSMRRLVRPAAEVASAATTSGGDRLLLQPLLQRDDVGELGVDQLEAEPLVGIERRQIVEVDAVADLLRLVEIDSVDLEQREVALAFLGRADLPLDRVAGAQAE